MTQKVKFSLEALKKLVDSDGSCVYCKEACTKSLALLPMHLKDLKSSVKELLAGEVTTYDAELDGIILAHKFVKVVDSVPLNDDGVLHVNYTADVYYFKPEIGSILYGTVYKKSKDFVGVLVHSIFNVAVPKPRSDTEESSWLGHHVSVGSNVVCRVAYLNFTGRLPYIRATLESAEETKHKKKHKKKDLTIESPLGFKKIRIPGPGVNDSLIGQAQMGPNESEEVSSSPKKKKKKKNRERSPQDKSSRNGNLDSFLVKPPSTPSPSSPPFTIPEASTPRTTLKMKRERSPRTPTPTATSSSDEGSKRKKKKLKVEESVVDDWKISLVKDALLSLKKEESSGESSSPSDKRKRQRKSSGGSSSSRSKPPAVTQKSADVQTLLNRAMEGIGVKSSEDERHDAGEHKKKKKKKEKKSKDLLE